MNAKNYSIVCYFESCNIEDSLEKLKLRGNCNAYAFILHDKDTDSDGNLKKPHYHLYLSFVNRQNDSILRKLFNTEIIDTCLNPSGYLMYMTHYGTDKYQYAPNQIKSFNIDVEQYLANCICVGSSEIDIIFIWLDYRFISMDVYTLTLRVDPTCWMAFGLQEQSYFANPLSHWGLGGAKKKLTHLRQALT